MTGRYSTSRDALLRLAAAEAQIAAARTILADFTHHEECDAASCDEGECACGWKVGEDETDESATKVHEAVCTCGIHKLRAALGVPVLGGAR